MRPFLNLSIVALMVCVVACREKPADNHRTTKSGATNLQVFPAKGLVKELKPDRRTVVIKHEAISNSMEAMTMPFHVSDTNDLAGLQPGDEISFKIVVTDSESWIEHVSKTGRTSPEPPNPTPPHTGAVQATTSRTPLLDYKFTNEFGQPISFNDFKGQALAYTFFFTRCPIPEFCPRLSKNFQESSQRLSAMTNAPTNWHFLSVSFDTEFDTPARLRAYGQRYRYDSNHWSFLTGPPDKIAELARLSDVNYERDGALYTHSFRTLIIDATGHLHMSYPIGGNLSDALAGDILKAAAPTNQ